MLVFCSLFFFSGLSLLTAQSDCDAFFPFAEGVEMEYANYNQNGKLESTAYHKIALVDNSNDGVSATVETRMADEKGKNVLEGEYTVTCKDNTLYMDVSNMLPDEMTSAFSTMDVTVSGDALVLPSSLSVGQILPDAMTEIKAATGGMNLMTMTVTITDRKVQARETVETPAGVFDCYKITHTTNSKMLLSKSFQSAEWYADGIGVVKSETYKNNGKLQSSMVLQRYAGR